MQQQKLEQGRAAFAFKMAMEGFHRHKKEYTPAAKKVPMMIKTNGLGAALAFMYSKQGVLGSVLRHLESWLLNENETTRALFASTKGTGLVQKVTELDSNEYRIVTIEAFAFLNWYYQRSGCKRQK
jgi:CRISPR-associated protein Cmr5